MAQGVPGRLRPRIISTFGTSRVVGRQPYAPAAFTPGEIPGTHFQSLSRPQGTWFCRKEPRKKSPVTSPVIYPGTVRLVAQRLNHYATPGPKNSQCITKYRENVCLTIGNTEVISSWKRFHRQGFFETRKILLWIPPRKKGREILLKRDQWHPVLSTTTNST